MQIPSALSSLYRKYKALPLRKRVIYTGIFVLWHALLVVIAIFSGKLQSHLGPLATRMERTPLAWLALSALIAVVSVPPLFGHELLAFIAGYVYGQKLGFGFLTISSIIGESAVYFTFRFWLRNYLDSFRAKYRKNYAVFVAVVEEGGLPMLWAIRMSIIPPHFSTPLFSSLESITWWKWILANILASPVKFFPPVFAGSLFRNKKNNSIFGDIAFVVSSLVTVAVLLYIRQRFMKKKRELKDSLNADDTHRSTVACVRADPATDVGGQEKPPLMENLSSSNLQSLTSISADGSISVSTISQTQSSPIARRSDIYELQSLRVTRVNNLGLTHLDANGMNRSSSSCTPGGDHDSANAPGASQLAPNGRCGDSRSVSQPIVGVTYDALYDPTIEESSPTSSTCLTGNLSLEISNHKQVDGTLKDQVGGQPTTS